MTNFFRKSGQFLLLALLFFSFYAQAQIIAPPKWTTSIDRENLKVGEEAKVIFEAQIPAGWYIYANDFDPDLGPILTTLELEQSEDYRLKGEFAAIASKKKYEDIWEGEVKYFVKQGRFEQTFIPNTAQGRITGLVKYQMCSDLTGQCVNYEEEIDLRFTASESKTTEPFTEFESSSKAEIGADPSLREGGTTTKQSVYDKEIATPRASARNDDNPSREVGESATTSSIEIIPDQEKESLMGFMVLAFLAGLAALLTPCVFPMIPMTVSFFTGRATNKATGIRNAIIYGFSIIAIYGSGKGLFFLVSSPDIMCLK